MTETYGALALLALAGVVLAYGLWFRQYADRLEKLLDEVYGPDA